MQPHCSGLVFKFLKAVSSAFWALFEQDGVVSVVEVHTILISDVYFHITSAVADDPVDGAAEESGANMHPLRTPDAVRKLSDRRPPCLTRDVVSYTRCCSSVEVLYKPQKKGVHQCSAGLLKGRF